MRRVLRTHLCSCEPKACAQRSKLSHFGENYFFQEILPQARATSEFGFEISRPPEKILGWKFDAEVAFYFLFRGYYHTNTIYFVEMIRNPWFRSILLPAILGRDFLHFGSNAESASHHFGVNVRIQRQKWCEALRGRAKMQKKHDPKSRVSKST